MQTTTTQSAWYKKLTQPPWRTVVPAVLMLACVSLAYLLWSPGAVVTDGRHDLGTNGIWMQHGWLGADDWFTRYSKTDQIQQFRNLENLNALQARLAQHHVTYLFPHLAPTTEAGALPAVHAEQVERFLDVFSGSRVLPWVGGAWGAQAHPERSDWRDTFVSSVRELLDTYPRFAGVHINIEPCPSGNRDFVLLLQAVRGVLRPGEILSVAAYPPPTRLHPYPEVHWDEAYFQEIVSLSDQMVVMMYDTSIRRAKLYESLMKNWTVRVLDWSAGTDVLLGLPAYDDTDADYHDPETENLTHSLAGIHAGLMTYDVLPGHYRGIAVYSEWELTEDEWATLRKHFLNNNPYQP